MLYAVFAINMEIRLYSLICLVASACLGLHAELQANFYNCPQISGPSVLKNLDVDNAGVERLVVYFYRARNSHQIVPFIPSRKYQDCIEDIAEEAGDALYDNFNGDTIQELYERIPNRTIRYRIKSAVTTELPLDNIIHGSQEYDSTDDTGHNDAPEFDTDTPSDVPIVYDIDDDKQLDWHIPVEELKINELPWRPDKRPRPDSDSGEVLVDKLCTDNCETGGFPGKLDSSPYYEYPDENISIDAPVVDPGSHDRETHQDLNINVVDDDLRPIVIKNKKAPVVRPLDGPVIAPVRPNEFRPHIGPISGVPVIRPLENLINGPNKYDKLQPTIKGKIEVPVIRPLENNNLDPKVRPIIKEENTVPAITSLENPITEFNNPDKLQTTITGNLKVPTIRKKESPFSGLSLSDEIKYQSNSEEDNDMSSRDFGSRGVNGELDINDDIYSLIIPKDHEYSQELNDVSDTHPFDEPSEEDAENSRDHLNLVYKWRKIKVPRVDRNGKVYGWIWKSVRSPVRSKSVKWSYWQSSGKKHRLTRWKHRSSSSSSKVYSHSSNGGLSVANFDVWLKKQIKNMKNNGNMVPSSDEDIYTVKLAIEKALKSNGIRVKSGGVFIDAEGNVLRLDNIQLRPIYIGRSLAYNHILKNVDKSVKYKIPTDTPFLEGLLVSLKNPVKTLGIVPLGIRELPSVESKETNLFIGSGRQRQPGFIQNGFHKFISGHLSGVGQLSPKLRHKVVVKDDSKSLSEEEPEYRIIGGSFAVGSGTPLANRGRSGKD